MQVAETEVQIGFSRRDLGGCLEFGNGLRSSFETIQRFPGQDMLMQQKQSKDALTALRRAVALDPTWPDAHYRLGQLYRPMGNTAAAQAEFNKVHELHEKADEGVASKMSVPPASSN